MLEQTEFSSITGPANFPLYLLPDPLGSKLACLTNSKTLCVQHFSENFLSSKITSGVAPTRANTRP